MDEAAAVASLRTVQEILDDFGVEFWLDGGALLGAIRKGKLIEWDTDFDLCIWNRDRQKFMSALRELERRGFEPRILNVPISSNVRIIQFKLVPFDVLMDFSLWDVEGDKAFTIYPVTDEHKQIKKPVKLVQLFLLAARHYSNCDIPFAVQYSRIYRKFGILIQTVVLKLPAKAKLFLSKMMQNWKLGFISLFCFVPVHYYEDFQTVRLYNLTVKIPSDVENYLTYTFGPDWRVPKRKKVWDWGKDEFTEKVFLL
jgi:phosphorylcholine metabolism protein LicD